MKLNKAILIIVRKIPGTFTSTAEYLSSFIVPLVVETHADLLSAMTRLSRAPSYQLSSIERDISYRAPIHFSYKIVLRNSNRTDLVTYRPQGGDLAALTDYEEDCAVCLLENNSESGTIPSFESYGLSDYQEAAIASCIKTWRCRHQNSVKLIWGPPGTGKTKTVGLLLLALLGDEGLRGTLYDTGKECEFVGRFAELRAAIKTCLPMLKSLGHSFRVPELMQRFMIKNLCLDNACILFCSASGSYKLNTEQTRPLDLLVIDEAAQRKECESTIPFQLPGLRHAVLVVDERQLPAMIRSKISGEAGYGRSRFERLVLLGQKKHLFNVQYRMHPSISSFPNMEFYDGLVLDATIVKHRRHEKRFLHGNMYGAYSFINLAYGKEQFGHLHSKKNMVEVAVVCNIVASLFKEFQNASSSISSNKLYPLNYLQTSVGLEKNYGGYSDRGFIVTIRSVDGFQVGEEDVIIISTVRFYINGSIGFLSNPQRENVALTRARHCLWILGNEETLVKSDSVWTKLVTDAKRRGCFFNADKDEHLGEAVVTALTDLEQFDTLLTRDSPLFKHARWRVCFGDDFNKSMGYIKNKEIHKQMIKVLENLASGWRDENMKKKKKMKIDENCFGLMEVYPVSGVMNLVWSVEVEMVKGNTVWIQVLKVWDIVDSSDIAMAAHKLRILFEEYTG
ncbi:hypothetical protein F3Y22_tig00110890pilonHSYRG00192 [Hibiscus syriacus]|uniref:Uncharacterized protein n=1 Tax=Hibiscus syriacus TaxID=106335 RepID=A0A6A2ZI41_HIBSY|nr:hypothetical protein F3Y22_tig00110890pilonHSYRG00192 [Hibiscus syriacus]